MERFEILPGCWSGWQMFPGYFGEHCVPYSSPVLFHEVRPLKTGKGLLRVKFLNAMYAEGVQTFELDLRVLKRSTSYLIAELVHGEKKTSDRCAVISHIEFDWIRYCCPEIWWSRPPTSCSGAGQKNVQTYLGELFLGRNV